MKSFITLIRKELREIAVISSGFLIIMAVAFVLSYIIPVKSKWFETPAIIIVMMSYLFPARLASSFENERKIKTNNLLFSLPVSRITIMFTKWCAIISIYLIIYIVGLLLYMRLQYLDDSWKNGGFEQIYFWVFSWAMVLTGIICTVEGMFSRYKNGYLKLSVGISLYLATYYAPKLIFKNMFKQELSFITYTYMAGVLFLIIGLLLYEKYGEV